MRNAKTPLLLLAFLAALVGAIVGAPVSTSGAPTAASSARTPTGFFGVAPQTLLTNRDVEYMRAGGFDTMRVPIPWAEVQPTPSGGYDFTAVDHAVATAARGGIQILPFVAGTPRWINRKGTRMPIDNVRVRRAWVAFVKAAVERYGPGGDFWTEYAPGNGQPEPVTRPLPIRVWQIWNEANFFYFAYPVSPSRYASLLKLTYPAIKSVDPQAKVVLSGLFGDPDEEGRRGMDATDFLDALYRTPGIKSRFDGVALHPYAFHVDDLEEMVEEMRAVIVDNRDRRAELWITEMGWGSQNDPHIVAFEQGIQGQARELRGAYRYLIANRGRLNLKSTYWFSWKDAPGYCNFCDSVGLFRKGEGFRPKPAWRAFVRITGGRVRP